MTELQLAYNLLRASLDSNAPYVGDTPLEASRWWSLLRLLQRNHVAALCFEAAASTDIPREVKIPWLAEREKAASWHRHQHKVQDEIVATMQAHGIQTLVLKGTHIAQYYPQADLREFGDLDLYFYDKHDEADRVAREVLKVEVSNDAHHHSKYNYHGVTVESHYDFINVHYPPSNRRYEALLKELVGSEDSLSTFNFQLSTFEILFLLRHMACHFASSRNTLRDIVDWTVTCRALQDKVDWQLVEKTIIDYGMTEYLSTLNTIAEQRLGFQPPCHSVTQSSCNPVTLSLVEKDLVYGSPEADDKKADGLARLSWKLRRWRALAWKRRMVLSDSSLKLVLASLTSHAEKPRSILHKQ